jgi:Cu2+-exporting ATPase
MPGKIIRLMEKAEQGHAQYVRLADRVARYYTPVVHLLALGTFLYWTLFTGASWQEALLIAMTVLIITCPCALGLAVPAVQVLTSSRLFRRGMLLKAADAVERMAGVDTVVFDKTGTLTVGRPQPAAGRIDPSRLQLAASLAASSRHPLAQALRKIYDGPLLPMEATERPGHGLEATWEGKTVRLGRRDWCGDPYLPADDKLELWLNVQGEKPLRFAFTDELRADATEVIAALKQQGYGILLLSGDREVVVAATAATLAIGQFRAQVSPVEKCAVIEALRREGKRVLMVGDGLNDAPALAAADVSMSPSSALDIAQNAADIVFQGEKLGAVLEALKTSRRAQRLVMENFVLATLYNVLAIPLAMAGHVTPLIAAVAMAASSIAVVLNAQRLNRA